MGCMLLAQSAGDVGDYKTAARLYNNILLTSPYDEGVAAKLLEIYTKQRQWKKREECFKSFTSRLKADLGVAPSEDVLLAYEMKKERNRHKIS